MTNEIREYIEKWLFRANEDIAVCLKLKETDSEFYASSICFHAQQAVEKFLKSYLTYFGIDFPRTHDVDFLLGECSRVNPSIFSDIDFKDLSEYGVSLRYPNDFYIPSIDEIDYYVNISLTIKAIVEEQIVF